jgi:hypothetical protein
MNNLDLTRDPDDKVTTREDIINMIIFQTKTLEELWKYHPNNPNRIDVVARYDEVQKHINMLMYITGE